MLLGEVLRELQDGPSAMQALADLSDVALLARVRVHAERFGEAPGEYAANAVRSFANQAGDEDWLALMTALERSDSAGPTCLKRMIEWALKRDCAPAAHDGCACGQLQHDI